MHDAGISCLCCFNRPYDDQSHGRIRLETEAKLILQRKIRDTECELVWSAILDFENSKNPFEEHMMAIQQWRKLAVQVVMADSGVVAKAVASNERNSPNAAWRGDCFFGELV